MTARRMGKNAKSITDAATGPMSNARGVAARSTSQREASANKAPPRNGRRLVQFGIAVSRKPASEAITTPKIISCAGH